jgi:hypothetical protein
MKRYCSGLSQHLPLGCQVYGLVNDVVPFVKLFIVEYNESTVIYS